MSNNNPVGSAGAASRYSWDEELVFDALRVAVRRRIFGMLAKKGWTPAVDLIVSHDRYEARSQSELVDSIAKHLAVMVEAGIVVKKENPGDRRRPLYNLSPNLTITVTDELIIVDVGFFVYRVRED